MCDSQDTRRPVASYLWRFKGYSLGFSLSAAILVFSVFAHTGFKEEHMTHWVLASLVVGFFSTALSRELITKDVAATAGALLALQIAGRLFWYVQDARSGDFSFENEYLDVYPWLWGTIGFGMGRLLRWGLHRIR